MPIYKKVWHPKLIIKAYDLAKEGYSDTQISGVIGVSQPTFAEWKTRHRLLGYALKRARKHRVDGGVEQFHEYVYKRLPASLKALWDEVMGCWKEGSGLEGVEALFSRHGVRARQHMLLYALPRSNFNISEACRLIGVGLKTYASWVKDDDGFGELMKEMDQHKKNFFEGALVDLVKRGDPSAVIFANRTQNRDRGYNEKYTLEVSGTVNHNHAVLAIGELDLPVEVRGIILEAIRKKKLEAEQAVIPTTARRITNTMQEAVV